MYRVDAGKEHPVVETGRPSRPVGGLIFTQSPCCSKSQAAITGEEVWSRSLFPFTPLDVLVSGSVHVPVLLREVLDQLELRSELVVVDGTVGAGGHSREIVSRLSPPGQLIGIDRDPTMLSRARDVLPEESVRLFHSCYSSLAEILAEMSLPAVDRVLLDLGLSSDQLADRTRGFGIQVGGQLDLRFDPSQGVSASEWLATATKSELEACFRDYGEERHASRIAESIVRARTASPIKTAEALAELVAGCVPRSRKAIHPATRVFQALRIQVNNELEELRCFMQTKLPEILKPGGRAVVISFHSLEDRIVKQAFRNSEIWEEVTPKPIEATPSEKRINPRSRSAKLRVAIRRPAAV